MIVVADTTPVNYLILIGEVDVRPGFMAVSSSLPLSKRN
jgi:hypothetical protein